MINDIYDSHNKVVKFMVSLIYTQASVSSAKEIDSSYKSLILLAPNRKQIIGRAFTSFVLLDLLIHTAHNPVLLLER